jgi:exopolysaccharide production protein ExoY
MFHSEIVNQSRNVTKPSQDIGGLSCTETPGTTQKFMKRIIDIAGALTFFGVFGPLYVTVALSIWLSGGGPIHYRQTRLGKDGKPFHVYKFRSMVANADQVLEEYLLKDSAARAEWDTFQKLNNDPRIIPIGKFIRRYSLDELPQFWNVLRGDMSLVGPRPCMERQRTLYGGAWAHYTAVRPGLTGLWQVSGRNNLTFAQRVALDTEYVTSWSLGLDLKILLKTFRAVMVDGK